MPYTAFISASALLASSLCSVLSEFNIGDHVANGDFSVRFGQPLVFPENYFDATDAPSDFQERIVNGWHQAQQV